MADRGAYTDDGPVTTATPRSPQGAYSDWRPSRRPVVDRGAYADDPPPTEAYVDDPLATVPLTQTWHTAAMSPVDEPPWTPSSGYRSATGPDDQRFTRTRMTGLTGTYRSWPTWARVAAPIAGAFVVLGLIVSVGGEDPKAEDEALGTGDIAAAGETTTTLPATTTVAPTTTVPPTTIPIVTAPAPTSPPPTDPPAPPPTVAVAPVAPPPTAPPPAPGPPSVYYENCQAAWDAGAAPVHVGDPGYAPRLDHDGDGVGCESPP